MSLTDYSPDSDGPTFEQNGTWYPSNQPKHDADGSITGCTGGHPFGRMQTRYAYVLAGKLLFRCADHGGTSQATES